MPVILPLDASDPIYRVGVTLDDTPYILDVRWNGRDQAWYFDLLDVTEAPIRYGIKIVLGAFMGARLTDSRKPPGFFFAWDTSGESRDATIDDLGKRVIVYYFSGAEFHG